MKPTSLHQEQNKLTLPLMLKEHSLTDSAWIDIIAGDGTVAGENDEGFLAFSADLSGLAPGDTGTIDVVSATQTNTLTVATDHDLLIENYCGRIISENRIRRKGE